MMKGRVVKMKKTIFAVMVVSVLLGAPAIAKNIPGLTVAPTLTDASWSGDESTLDLIFSRVAGAVKYSVSISGLATYVDANGDPNSMEIEIDITVPDVADNDPNIIVSISAEDILAEITEELADLGVAMPLQRGLLLSGNTDDEDPDNDSVMVKVKGLNPGKPDSKRQNNPFSESLAIGNRLWTFVSPN